jgi:hypothetical protein
LLKKDPDEQTFSPSKALSLSERKKLKARMQGKKLAGSFAEEYVQLKWLKYSGDFWMGKVGRKTAVVILNPPWIVYSFTVALFNDCVTRKGKWVKISPGDSSRISSPPLPIFW